MSDCPRIPEPRTGPAGLLDRYLGPEATALDRIRVALACLGGALLGGLTVSGDPAARLLLALLAAELCAGSMAQLNHAGKAWTHSRHRRVLRHGLFLTTQLVVLGLFVWLFRDGDLALLLTAAGLLAAGSAVVLLTALRWQRAIGLLALLGAMFTLQALHGLPANGAWFLPLFYGRAFLAYLPAPLESPPDRASNAASR